MAFESKREEFEALGVKLVALSVDSLEKARSTQQGCGLGFPVMAGLPLVPTATALTAFYEVRRSILHATGFVVRPGGAIAVVCYSTGPVGRLEPVDVASAVRFWQAK